jgi:hypothetical protein
MKLLFFSPDNSEVAEVSKELKTAGIACEVRRAGSRKGHAGSDETEIWIQHDRDCHRALLLCVERGIGFARRPSKSSVLENWTDITSGTRVVEEEAPVGSLAKLNDTRACAHRIRKLKAA